jgi:hypothetical protein
MLLRFRGSREPAPIEHFYIVGCQRSGTTLMRLILESHPAVSCFDEDLSYRMLLRPGSWRARRLLRHCKTKLVGFKVPRFTEQLLDDRLRDPDYGSSPNFYRTGQRVIFMHRDVRDVVASMLRLRQPDGTRWIDRYGRLILADRMRESEFRTRYADASDRVNACGFTPHTVAALYWRYKSEAYFDYREAGLPVLGLAYERLVAQPRQELSSVLEFLAVKWDERVLVHPRMPHGELRPDRRVIGRTDPRRPIDRASVSRFSDVLGPTELEEVRAIAGSTAERLEKDLNT